MFPILRCPRENLLLTLDGLFSAGIDTVVVEAPDGYGKSTLAELFAERHAKHALSLTIRTGSHWAYDPLFVESDLSHQIAAILGYTNAESVGADSGYRDLLYKLQRRAKQRNEKYYFVVDGLHEIKADSLHVLHALRDLLPFQLPGFRFLITQTYDGLAIRIPGTSKTFPVPLLTRDEVRQLLPSDRPLKESEFCAVYDLSRGIPSWVASIARLLSGGSSVESLLNSTDPTLNQLFEIEWDLTAHTANADQVLSLISFAPSVLAVGDICRLTTRSRVEIEAELSQLSYIVTNSEEQVGFVSEPFLAFARKRLESKRQHVDDVIINDLLARESQVEAALAIPAALNHTRRYDELLDFLTADRIDTTISACQSLVPICHNILLGVEASITQKRDGDLLRLSLHSTVIEQQGNAEGRIAEVSALIAVDDFSSALRIANESQLREDRFQLLTKIAKGKKDKGLFPEPELLDSIKALFSQVTKNSLGRRAFDIAIDLVHILPDMAAELVEGARQSDPRGADLTLFSLAAGARQKESIGTGADEETALLRERIRSPELRRFTEEVVLVARASTSGEILAQIANISTSERKLLFLRLWMLSHSASNDASIVLDAALQLAVEATEYTPTARDIRELACGLPYISDIEVYRKLRARLNAQLPSLKERGPTVDFCRLLIDIARAEYKHSHTDGIALFNQAQVFAQEVADLSIRVECLGYVLVGLHTAGSAQLDLKPLYLKTELEIDAVVDKLKAESALHDQVFSGVLKALAPQLTANAMVIAESFNTKPRREAAISDVIEAAMAATPINCAPSELFEYLKRIQNPDKKDAVVADILDSLSKNSHLSEDWLSSLGRFLPEISSMRLSDSGCEALCNLYRAAATAQSHPAATKVRLEVQKRLQALTDKLDAGWDRVSAAYQAAETLAPISNSEAKAFISRAGEIRQEAAIATPTVAKTVSGLTLLAIRAMDGLSRSKLRTQEDSQRLALLIDSIPSEAVRVFYWSEVALKAFFASDAEECQRIVATRIRPVLQQIKTARPYQYASAYCSVSPSLYCCNPVLTRDELEHLNDTDRDIAIHEIVGVLLSKRSPTDAYEPGRPATFAVTYDDSMKIINLLRLVSADYLILSAVSNLVDGLLSRRSKRLVTREQIAEISRALADFARSEFPKSGYISHEGYGICTEALAAQLSRSAAGVFNALADRARSIPNTSDRSFVLTVIASATRDRSLRGVLLKEAGQIAQSVPCAIERISRNVLIGKQSYDYDVAVGKALLLENMKAAASQSDERAREIQREIIDFAYGIDPEWAQSLVEAGDGDEARVNERHMLRRHMNTLKAAEDLKDGNWKMSVNHAAMSKAAWKMLGQLNAERIPSKHYQEMRTTLEAASRLPFDYAYAIFSWAFENAISRYSGTDQASRVIRPMFEASLLGARIVVNLERQGKSTSGLAAFASSATGPKVVFAPGEREPAIRALRSWLERRVRKYVKICDPYFGLDDLEALHLVAASEPSCEVFVLTSLKKQENDGVSPPFETAFRRKWRELFDHDPPRTEIVIVGSKASKQLPIHDRWWVTAGSGLRMGTSFSSLGLNRESELSELSAEESLVFEERIDGYLTRRIKEGAEGKLSYVLFNLDD